MSAREVLVEVIGDVQSGREVSGGRPNVAEQLERRLDDIRDAMVSGTAAIAAGLTDLKGAEAWHIAEVSASFGVVLTAEAGVLLTKASAGATFEVNIKFRKTATK